MRVKWRSGGYYRGSTPAVLKAVIPSAKRLNFVEHRGSCPSDVLAPMLWLKFTVDCSADNDQESNCHRAGKWMIRNLGVEYNLSELLA